MKIAIDVLREFKDLATKINNNKDSCFSNERGIAKYETEELIKKLSNLNVDSFISSPTTPLHYLSSFKVTDIPSDIVYETNVEKLFEESLKLKIVFLSYDNRVFAYYDNGEYDFLPKDEFMKELKEDKKKIQKLKEKIEEKVKEEEVFKKIKEWVTKI